MAHSKPEYLLSSEVAELDRLPEDAALFPTAPLTLEHFPELKRSFSEAVQRLNRMIKNNAHIESGEIQAVFKYDPDVQTFKSSLTTLLKSAKIQTPCDSVEVVRENGLLVGDLKQQPLFEEGVK